MNNISKFNPLHHVLRSCSPRFRVNRDGSRSTHYDIPWTKSTQQRGATVVVTARDDRLCPCTPLKNHLIVNAAIPSEASLFAFRMGPNSWQHMSKHNFLSFVNKVWLHAGLSNLSGHSFRIGGAVELLLAGVAPEVIAATGGWTSLAFLLYWR